MGIQYKKTALAVAMTACISSGAIYATEAPNDQTQNAGTSVSAASAIVSDSQIAEGNVIQSKSGDNQATIDGYAMENTSGNVGVNMASGDNNMQANAAAIATAQSDAAFVFDDPSAEVFIEQRVQGNRFTSSGTSNVTRLEGHAITKVTGNVGANIASGSFNLQKNDFAVSVSNKGPASAIAGVSQQSLGNAATTEGRYDVVEDTTTIKLEGASAGTAYGQGYGHYSGSSSAAIQGDVKAEYTGSAYGTSVAHQKGRYKGSEYGKNGATISG
ncbi:MAG TPA: hypothetical protein ENI98_05545, partial [Gammaproteobacteria bacterium]|nr:hypothetical protein [Gammaproteobacteria bacterium]